MTQTVHQRWLCVCVGNSDRSPVLAAILNMFLKNAGHNVSVESAGIGESASKNNEGAARFAVAAAKRLGLDISSHRKQRTTSLNLGAYDLFICVSDGIAAELHKQGVPQEKLYNAEITNPWPCQFHAQYDTTMEQILVASNRIMGFYFP